VVVLGAGPAYATSRYAGATNQGKYISVTLSSTGSEVALRIYYSVACDDGSSGDTYTDLSHIPFDHGAFQGEGTYKGATDGSDNRFSVAGNLSGDSASGSFELTASIQNSDGTTLTCHTGRIDWSASRLGAPPAQARLRYCDRPGVAGQYIAATANVSCRTARQVTAAMFSNRCINRITCQSHGFTCRSHYPGANGRPFAFTHHGTCLRGKNRRIEFDGG
jgi:hypothetical protein